MFTINYGCSLQPDMLIYIKQLCYLKNPETKFCVMILCGLLLVFTSLEPLQSWKTTRENQTSLFGDWGLTRIRRQKNEDLWENRFPDDGGTAWSCDTLHMTDETPFVAIVLFKTSGRFLCMGSIVDKNHILSAKKCYDRTDVNDLLVLVGYYKPYWGRNSQVIKVKKIVRHEGYVLLLRLSNDLRFSDYVQPVRLPSSATREFPFTETYPPPYKIAGFNVDKYDVPGEFMEKDKVYQIKENYLTELKDCYPSFPKLHVSPDELFCTTGNASFCWGGRGAPLLKWVTHSHFLQVGVVVVENCSTEVGGPFMAARTDMFTDWVRGNSFHGRDQ